ncbi:hypothetical protein ACHAXR_013074 [Thalassiosira sp. AJA248-18]
MNMTMATKNANSRSRSALTAVLLTLLAIATAVSSFSTQPTIVGRPNTRLSAIAKPKPFDPSYKAKPPTFDKKTSQWQPSPETEDAPYGAWGSFLRGGPTPGVLRILKPDDYDQAVFKYMAQTSCSRAEAQGNMDAYFNNAADWAYQKSEEARGRPQVDYSALKPKQAVLVVTWAFFVTPFLGRCAYLIAFSDSGWDISLDDVFNF